MTTLNKDQLQDLREEFIEFKINEMTSEDMASYIRDIMLHDVNVLNKEELGMRLTLMMTTCMRYSHLMYLMNQTLITIC